MPRLDEMLTDLFVIVIAAVAVHAKHYLYTIHTRNDYLHVHIKTYQVYHLSTLIRMT